MPTGDFVPRGRRRSGFAYMGLLMLLALLGAALGEAGQVWRTQAQREREAAGAGCVRERQAQCSGGKVDRSVGHCLREDRCLVHRGDQ